MSSPPDFSYCIAINVIDVSLVTVGDTLPQYASQYASSQYASMMQ